MCGSTDHQLSLDLELSAPSLVRNMKPASIETNDSAPKAVMEGVITSLEASEIGVPIDTLGKKIAHIDS